MSKSTAAITYFILLAIALTCAGQTVHLSKKTASKGRSGHSNFICPEPEAQKGCKSYQELVKAKDTGLPDTGYVCFRRDTDEFFTIWFSIPHFRKHWDSGLKQMVVDDDASYPGRGYATSYKDGVGDSRISPSFAFSGTWRPLFGESSIFASETIDAKKIDVNDKIQTVSVDDSQFNATRKYQNAVDQTIVYSLTIQRSTGRFTESFREEVKQVPFLESVGRCVFIPAVY